MANVGVRGLPTPTFSGSARENRLGQARPVGKSANLGYVLDAGLPAHPVPESEVAAARPRRVARRGKNEGACPARLTLENCTGLRVEGNRPSPRLALLEDQATVVDFRLAELHDLALAAPGQQHKAHDIGLRLVVPSGLPVKHAVQTVDFFARQEAGEHWAPVPLYVASRVGVEVAAGDGEIQDLTQEGETVIGIAGGGSAEIVEPASDLGRDDAVEPLRTEGRQDAAVEQAPEGISGRRLVSVEAGFHSPATKSRNRGAACLGADLSSGSGAACRARQTWRASATLAVSTGPRETRFDPLADRCRRIQLFPPVVRIRTPSPRILASQMVYSRATGVSLATLASVRRCLFAAIP